MLSQKKIQEIFSFNDNALFNKNFSMPLGSPPKDWEDKLRQASVLKRQGRYEDSVNIYLDLMNNSKTVYSKVLKSLYETILCSGHIVAAVVINHARHGAYGEIELSPITDATGIYPDPQGGRLITRPSMLEFELSEASFNKWYDQLLEYVDNVSENINYNFPRDINVALQEFFDYIKFIHKLDE